MASPRAILFPFAGFFPHILAPVRRGILISILFLPLAAGFEWPGKLYAVASRLTDPDPKQRLEALASLAIFDSSQTTPLVLPLLDDSSQAVSLAAARLLASHRVTAALPKIASWLTASDKTLRASAATLLGDLRSEDAVSALTRALVDIEADVRKSAVEALGKIDGPEVVVPLIGRLEDENSQVRRAAATELAHAGDPRALVPLMEHFVDTSKDVRIAAITAAGKSGDRRLVSALRRQLNDSLDEVKVAAVEALGRLRAKDATEDLLPLLSRPNDELRAKVALALAQIGEPRGLRALVTALAVAGTGPAARAALSTTGTHAIPILIECLDDGFPCDPQAVVLLLGSLHDTAATPALLRELSRGRVRRDTVLEALATSADVRALVPLLTALKDSDANIRKKALLALEPLVDGRAGDQFVDLLDDEDPDVAARAAEVLATLRTKTAAPKLLAKIGPKNPPGLRVAALRALGQLGDASASRPLLALLVGEGSEDGDLKRTVATALADLADPGIASELLDLADSASQVRESALVALVGVLREGQLSHRDDESARVRLERLATTHDVRVVLGAIDALSAMHMPASGEALRTLATHADRQIRRAGLEALGQFDDDKTVSVLSRALMAPDDATRAAAAWALGKLGRAETRTALRRAARTGGLLTTINATAALAHTGCVAKQCLGAWDGADLRLDAEVLAAHANGFVRANAALLLGRIADPKSRPVLLSMLETDGNPYARAAAARVLNRFPDSAEALAHAAEHDPNPLVRGAAGIPAAPPSFDDWARLTWSEDDDGAANERYVLIDSTGRVKAGVRDPRGEAVEEGFPRGPWQYEILDEAGESVPLTR